MKSGSIKDVRIVGFGPQFRSAYIRMNREWIEKHFVIEAMDIAQLEDAKSNILDRGGEILILLEDGIALGTCALVPHGKDTFELAKMAVDNSARGKGYGDLLIKQAITWAEAKGAHKLYLLSNTVLEPAISLYRKHGFKTLRLGPHPDYKRCNIEMELTLS